MVLQKILPRKAAAAAIAASMKSATAKGRKRNCGVAVDRTHRKNFKRIKNSARFVHGEACGGVDDAPHYFAV